MRHAVKKIAEILRNQLHSLSDTFGIYLALICGPILGSILRETSSSFALVS